MANMYHINGETGRINICRAGVRACPVGPASEHFNTKEEAKAHIEKTEESKNEKFTTVRRINTVNSKNARRVEGYTPQKIRDEIKYFEKNISMAKHEEAQLLLRLNSKLTETEKNDAIARLKNVNKEINEYENELSILKGEVETRKNGEKTLDNMGKKSNNSQKPPTSTSKDRKYAKRTSFTKNQLEYPDGSLVEFTVPPRYTTSKNIFGRVKRTLVSEERVVTGRIINNSTYIHDSSSGVNIRISDLKKSRGKARIIYKAPVENLIKAGAIRRDKDAFDKEFKVGDTIQIYTNYGDAPSNDSNEYTIIENDTNEHQALLLNKTSGEELLLKNEDFLKSGRYNFSKKNTNNSPNTPIAENNINNNRSKSMDDYINGITPYPVDGFPGDDMDSNVINSDDLMYADG